MIEEEYVSFETAKLLKEKGFNEKVICYYDDGGSLNLNKFVEFQCCNQGYGCSVFAAPTLQMAMKWLREVYNIHIVVHPYTDMEGQHWSFIFDKYAYGCWQELSIYITDSWNSYEEACDTAIKYCLEHLI